MSLGATSGTATQFPLGTSIQSDAVLGAIAVNSGFYVLFVNLHGGVITVTNNTNCNLVAGGSAANAIPANGSRQFYFLHTATNTYVVF